MQWAIYLFGSGLAFFAGVAIVLAAAAAMALGRRPWSKTAGGSLAIVGLFLIGASAAPLPTWFYVVAGAVSLLWLVIERLPGGALDRWRVRLRLASAALWLAGAAAEAPHHLTPTIQARGRPTLYLFGDSVSAGIGEAAGETWPQLLAEARSIDVQNHSQAGATVRTALEKAAALSLGEGLVLLEIGGNDLLGGTPPADFERDLDALMKRLRGPGRTLLMFELPLPPLANAFGRIQRRLAQRHGVQLIPKRHFMDVLTVDQGTVDSIHLSRRGHEVMAEKVWQVIGPAYE